MLGSMSAVAIVWLVVGVTTMILLAAFMLQLVRQVKRLTSSVVQFQQEVQPVLESIQRDAQAAQEHSERLQHEAEELRASPDGEAGRRGNRPRARARR